MHPPIQMAISYRKANFERDLKKNVTLKSKYPKFIQQMNIIRNKG